jgi:outer membrane protein assembly factor BamB
MSIVAALLLLALQDTDQNDHILIRDEVTESFNRRWADAEEERNYKELLALCGMAYSSMGDKLARPDPTVSRWIPLTRVLAARLATLPPASLEAHEIVAKQELDDTRASGRRRKAIEKYLYTEAGRGALEQQANVDCDQGRIGDAMRGWSRALEVRPSAETVARFALAHAMRDDGVALATLKATVKARGLKGQVVVAGRSVELDDYLDSLVPGRPRGEPAAPLLKPAPAPTNEILLGHYDLREDGRYGDHLAVSLPAAGTANGKELVLVSNGLRVTAVSVGRAEGGSVEDAIEWHFPKQGPWKTYTQTGYQSFSLPYVGVTVSDGLAFCPMFPEHQEAQQQRGRRQQPFLGASALYAIDLATGAAVWDTDSIIVDKGGSRTPLMEYLNFKTSDFCFGGPPVVHGDRLYAPVMTSPYTGRHCWVLCLDARSGQPVWCTDVGTAPQSKSMSVAQVAEEDGTVVLSTNFGMVAALDSGSGSIEWIVKYLNDTRPIRPSYRPAASPPVIAGSLVYILTQDCDELLAFDRWTGLEAALPRPKAEVPWPDVVHFIGRAQDWLVFSGTRNVALRPLDGEVVNLPDVENSRLGRGTISGDRLYLPTIHELLIFDTKSWRQVESLKWPEATSGPGNTIVAGSVVAHMSDRLDLYTSLDLLRDRFGLRDGAAPAKPQDSRQVARILEGAGLLKDAVPYYRRALTVWEKDPAWQETADGLRKKLADLAEKLGADFPKE